MSASERRPLDVETLRRLDLSLPWIVARQLVPVWPAVLAALERAERLEADIRTLFRCEVISYFAAEEREQPAGSVMGSLKSVEETDVPDIGAILREELEAYWRARTAAPAAESVTPFGQEIDLSDVAFNGMPDKEGDGG